jgi:secreted trypsin-like serine protease
MVRLFLVLLISLFSIVNGNAVNYPKEIIKDNEYSFIVNIYNPIYKDSNCSGSLIDSRIVLTAAHCIYGLKGDLIVVKNDGESANVIGKIAHPNYRNISSGNDIGILLLNKTLKSEKLSLPSNEFIKNYSKYKENLLLGGYGIDENGNSVKRLAIADQRDITDKGKSVFGRGFDGKNIIAAGKWVRDKNRYSGACSGDSGGPLFVKSSGYILVGVVSFGAVTCAESGLPTIYTRISYYNKWINEAIVSLNNAFMNVKIKGGNGVIFVEHNNLLSNISLECEKINKNKVLDRIGADIISSFVKVNNVLPGNYNCFLYTADKKSSIYNIKVM